MHCTVLHNFLRTEDSEATKTKHWVKKHESNVLENLHNLPFRPLQSRPAMADLQGWHDYILSGICIPGDEDKVQDSVVSTSKNKEEMWYNPSWRDAAFMKIPDACFNDRDD
ncbi:hypothetical protein NC651_003002 [Populus alba x Populus x berolinensis]|nr:hypothetical protein NC651_003002 [Populus alba x Populus x berolinensis]